MALFEDGRKVLVLGASSYVGRRLSACLGADNLIATYNATPLPGGVRFDSTSMDLADVIADPSAITAAVLLLGDTKPDSCIADTARSRQLNVDSVERVVDRLVEWGIHPIFTSTEFVFDGEAGGYVETDEPNPILLYGAQKLEVERYLAACAPNASILRLAKVFGEELEDGTLLTGALKALISNPRLKVASDQRFSAVHVDDVCDAIAIAAQGRLPGLYHCAGPEACSRLEYFDMVADGLRKAGVAVAEIEPCSIRDFPLTEPRPLDVTMASGKMSATAGMVLRAPSDAARRVVARYLETLA